MKVNKQVRIPFSIGKYEDEVLCDVAQMHVDHILLGRPWKFDRRVMHDGYKNRYSFVMSNRKFILTSLKPLKLIKIRCKLQESVK